MKKPVSVAISCGILVGLMLAGCGSANESELIISAKEHLNKREIKAAIVQLKSALQRNSNSGEARFLLGGALFEDGDLSSAMLELSKARELNYDESKVLPKLARVMLAQGKLKPLIDEMSGKTFAQPQAQAELHTALAVAFARQNRASDSAVEVEKALAADAKYPLALRAKARLTASVGDIDGALRLVDDSMIQNSPNGEAWRLRADLLFYGKKDAVGAIEALNKATEDPKEAQAAHLAIFGFYLAKQDMEGARARLELIKKAYPKHLETVYATAQLAYLEKDFNKAKELLQALMRVVPNNPVLLAFSGEVNFQRGEWIQAESNFGKALQFAPQMGAVRKLMAETYLQMGQPTRVHVLLRPLIETALPDPAAIVLGATAYLQEGEIGKAEAAYIQARKLKPKDLSIRTALALAELAKGRTGEAFEALQTISADDRGTTADLALISAHLRRGEFDAALGAIDHLEQKEPRKPTANFLRGVVHRNRRNFGAARSAFEAALKLEPNHFASAENLASLDLADSDFGRARQRLESILKLSPANIAARMGVIDVMLKEHAPTEQIEAALNDAIQANPIEPAPRIALIESRLTSKDYKAALSAAQSAIAALPDDVGLMNILGRVQMALGDDLQAIGSFSRVISMQPRWDEPYLQIVNIYERRNDTAAAVSMAKRAFDVIPESSRISKQLVILSIKAKDLNLALNLARDYQKRHPTRAFGFLFEGDIFFAHKNFGSAIASYRQALGKDSGEGQRTRAPINLHAALSAGGLNVEAANFAAQWLSAHPKDVDFLVHLGGVDILRRDMTNAERRFAAVLSLEPQNLVALNNFAWLLAERRGKGAVSYAERAASLAPGDAPIFDTLAKALAADAKIGRAIEAEQRAVRLAPDHHSYRLALARLYVQAGDSRKAMAELDALDSLGAKVAFQSEVADLRKQLKP